MVPDQRFAIIVLTNKSGGRLEKTVEKAMEMMLPLTAKSPDSPRTPLPMSESEMAKYVGTYVHSPRQSMEIVVQGGKLLIKDEDALIPLTKIGQNLFLMNQPGTPEPEELALVPDAKGAIEFLHINGRAFKKLPPK